MCELTFSAKELKCIKHFNLESELYKVFTKEKADRIIMEIMTNPTYNIPCIAKPISIKAAGPSQRFTDRGNLVDWNSDDVTSVYRGRACCQWRHSSTEV